LQTADSAMQNEYIQLNLILKNISLPVNPGASLYAGVTTAWKQAMTGLEGLLNGEPQSVTDGAILLAISAWHIYPDLLVLGSQITNVVFSDTLVPSGTTLTVGVSIDRTPAVEDAGIYWPVALSHYRFYGNPTTTVGQIEDRLTMEELGLATLGSLLASWDTPRAEIEASAPWFIALADYLDRVDLDLKTPAWLQFLSDAARRLVDSTGSTKKDYLGIVNFGYRRGGNFLVSKFQSAQPLPWFGLRCAHLTASLAQPSAKLCAVEYLRQVAQAGGLNCDQGLIAYVEESKTSRAGNNENHEYCTAVCLERPEIKPELGATEIPDMEFEESLLTGTSSLSMPVGNELIKQEEDESRGPLLQKVDQCIVMEDDTAIDSEEALTDSFRTANPSIPRGDTRPTPTSEATERKEVCAFRRC
jgi:hypothetical protein